MNEFEYKPNSHKSKQASTEQSTEVEKRVEKVVTGNVKTRKNSEAKKLANVFIAEDISTVKNYIWMDVLVPTIKKAVSDIITNGIDMILYGGHGRPKNSTGASKVSYSSYYKNEERRSEPERYRTYDYDTIEFERRTEAEEVLYRMRDLRNQYGIVRVADFYDLVGVTTGSYTDNKYGWTSLNNAEVVRSRGMYVIKLPRAMPID